MMKLRRLPRSVRALVQAQRVLTGRQMAGRGATIFPDDVYLVSYPRSGNTWMRFLLGNLLYPEPANFTNIESRVAEIYFNPDHILRRLPRPRLLKSHEAFHPNYPRVIYVVRDPRDVAVSFYHHNVKARNLPDGYPLDDFVPRFIRAEFDPWWGSWEDNVKSWMAMRQGSENFLCLRYEEMKRNPQEQLLKIAAFLEQAGFASIDSSPTNLARAVELSSPERMRLLEKSAARSYPQLKQTRQDKPFVRGAEAGGWRSSLSAGSVALIEDVWGTTMKQMRYEIGVRPNPS